MSNKEVFKKITKDKDIKRLKTLVEFIRSDMLYREALLTHLTKGDAVDVEVIEKSNEKDVLIGKALKMRIKAKTSKRLAQRVVRKTDCGTFTNPTGDTCTLVIDEESSTITSLLDLHCVKSVDEKSRRQIEADKETHLQVAKGYTVGPKTPLIEEFRQFIKDAIQEELKKLAKKITDFVESLKTSKNIPSSKIPKNLSTLNKNGFTTEIQGEQLKIQLSEEEVTYIMDNHPNIRVSPVLKAHIQSMKKHSKLQELLKGLDEEYSLEADDFGIDMLHFPKRGLVILLDGHDNDPERVESILKSGAEHTETSTSEHDA